jgi:hypothetical protein
MIFYDSLLYLILVIAKISMLHFRCECGRIHKLEIYCPYMISRTYDIQFKIGILFPKLFWPTVRKNSPEQFIQTVKVHNNFWDRMFFFNCSWKFLRPNTLEQVKLEKIMAIQKPTGKVRKVVVTKILGT